MRHRRCIKASQVEMQAPPVSSWSTKSNLPHGPPIIGFPSIHDAYQVPTNIALAKITQRKKAEQPLGNNDTIRDVLLNM